MEEQPESPKSADRPASAPDSESPRRCFICLADETEDPEPQDWVTPCPCTLEGHQACMLSWVQSREGDGRRLECPVCKAPIQVAGPWNPIVELQERWSSAVSAVSPWVLGGAVVGGVFASNFAHGLWSLTTLAGWEAARSIVLKAPPSGGDSQIRVTGVFFVTNFTPALVILRLVPGLGVTALPTVGATFMGVAKLLNPDFGASNWPPSPWGALYWVVCLRSAYFRLYRSFFLKWERSIDRRLANLPDEEEPAEPRGPHPRPRQVGNVQVGGGGIIGWFLHGLIEALEGEVHIGGGENPAHQRRDRRRRNRRAARRGENGRQRRQGGGGGDVDGGGGGGADGDGDGGDDGEAVQRNIENLRNRLDALNRQIDAQIHARLDEADRLQNMMEDRGAVVQRLEETQREEGAQPGPAPEGTDAVVDNELEAHAEDEAGVQNEDRDEDGDQDGDDSEDDDQDDAQIVQVQVEVEIGDVIDDDAPPAPAIPAPAPPVPGVELDGPANPNPPAPARPAGRGIGALVDGIAREMTVSLLFPVLCWSFGELLRHTILPRSWTLPPSSFSRAADGGSRRPSSMSIPGLLSTQWGRSMLGGCVFVVLRDAVRMYAKYRKLKDRTLTKVVNVERKRRPL